MRVFISVTKHCENWILSLQKNKKVKPFLDKYAVEKRFWKCLSWKNRTVEYDNHILIFVSKVFCNGKLFFIFWMLFFWKIEYFFWDLDIFFWKPAILYVCKSIPIDRCSKEKFTTRSKWCIENEQNKKGVVPEINDHQILIWFWFYTWNCSCSTNCILRLDIENTLPVVVIESQWLLNSFRLRSIGKIMPIHEMFLHLIAVIMFKYAILQIKKQIV